MTNRNQQVISVIDDCCDNLLLMQLLLESEGYLVNCAVNGTEGLKQVENLNPNLIIVDLMMPDISGLEVIDRLNKSPDSFDIPTILLTAHAGISREKAPNADSICIKPFDFQDFLSQVKFLLSLGNELQTTNIQADCIHLST